jgi:succinyl-CoA synthetase beta subunit
MNLHEYQAKELLAEYDIPVPEGEVAWNVEEALKVPDNLGGRRWVVKAQVHAGGRGKSGGVKIVSSKEELEKEAQRLLGSRLVTYQTDEKGQPVDKLWIEKPSNIGRELYLGAVVDRNAQRVIFMASTEGGVEIETVADETPDKIIKMEIDPLLGVMPYQAREVAFNLGLSAGQVKQFVKIMIQMGKMFVERDFAMLEVNPLVVTTDGNLVCLDAKIEIDDNALYRRPQIRPMRDPSQEDERENRARDWDLSYIALDGNIGCMVNGAGLAMATMDIIKLYGGEPANFLDVGGGATKERVTEAFKIILSDENVKGVLVNIFGGIVRCDLIADGIIGAVKEVDVKGPVVVRLAGTNAKEGAKLLEGCGLNIISATDLADAADKIVKAVGEGK